MERAKGWIKPPSVKTASVDEVLQGLKRRIISRNRLNANGRTFEWHTLRYRESEPKKDGGFLIDISRKPVFEVKDLSFALQGKIDGNKIRLH